MSDTKDTTKEAMEEARIVILTMLDQIDGDPRASQWFDNRLVKRARDAAARLSRLALAVPPTEGKE